MGFTLSQITQYTLGSMVTLTLTVTEPNGNLAIPDNNQTPTVNVFFETPSGPVEIIANKLFLAINNSYYYTTIDSVYLSVGSYIAVSSWIYQGQQMNKSLRFDILAFDGQVILPLDPISRLRIALKDNNPNPTRWIWSDQELSEYLNRALENFNSMPPRGNFFWYTLPVYYYDCILLYAQYLAIQAQAFKLASQGVAYNDRNISLNIPAQAQMYQSMASTLQQIASDKAKLLKRQYGNGFTSYISTPSIAYASNIPLRVFGGALFGN